MNKPNTNKNKSKKSFSKPKSTSNTSSSTKPKPTNNKPTKKRKEIDHTLLVQKASGNVAKKYESKRTFDDLPINPKIKLSISKKGYTKPTEIQDKTIDILLKGRNLLGIAQTGTGKTAAFLIPIIEELLKNKQNSFALIVAPTRELALQIEQEFKSMSKGLGLFSACFIGGTNINNDIQILRRPPHITICTPGRVLDLVNRRVFDLRVYKTLVLDEFDRMLDMGFRKDVERILYGMQQRKHTMLFSATLDPAQQELIDHILERYDTVKVSSGTTTTDRVEQDVVKYTEADNKIQILIDLLKQDEFKRVIIFEEMKHKVKRLCISLNKAGIKAEQIHGDKTQASRQKALESFKQGESQVLVATDVAARGIDVSDVTHVINYQVPSNHDTYIHRIGRTGRAGKIGKALTFVEVKSKKPVQD